MKKKFIKLTDKKIIVCIMVLILGIQLALSLFWADQKQYLAPDELFSYVSANNPDYIGKVPKDVWLNEGWYTEYASAQDDHTFEYGIPYYNQDKDVHPPLFYLFLHTACSLIPGEFSFPAGTAFNIVFFMACTIVLYFLTKEVFKSRGCGLLTALLFAVSYAGLNTMVFVRMYMLMALFVLLHALVYMKYIEQEKIPFKGYFFLGLTLVAGMLTQYYFVMIAFFFALWYGVRFLSRKEYKKTLCFVGTFAVSAGVSIGLYPTMVHHIFGTSRGVEARENLSSAGGYLGKLKTMWGLLESQLFTNVFFLILLGIVVLILLSLVCKKELSREPMWKIGVILFASCGYFLIVTKIAPYQIDRYLMPIYPLVYMVVIGIVFGLMKQWIPSKVAGALCILGFGGLSAIHMMHSSIPYTYAKDEVVVPRIELAREYSDTYAVYVGEEEDMYDYFNVVQTLKEHKGFYNIGNLNQVAEIRNGMAKLESEEEFLLYVNHEIDLGEVVLCMKEVFPELDFTGESILHTDEEWKVYLIRKSFD